MASPLTFDLAGTRYGDADTLAALPRGTRLTLERDADNPHDPSAIAVFVTAEQLAEQGVPEPVAHPPRERWKLGMVPGAGSTFNWARYIAPFLDERADLCASLVSMEPLLGRRTAPPRIRIGIDGDDVQALARSKKGRGP
jgi:hypothetical protein